MTPAAHDAHSAATVNSLRVALDKAVHARDAYQSDAAHLAQWSEAQNAENTVLSEACEQLRGEVARWRSACVQARGDLTRGNRRADALEVRINMVRTLLEQGGRDADSARREALALLDSPLPGTEERS